MLDAAALLIAMLWLSACAMDGSDARAPCPPVVDYSAAEQARAADEVEALPEFLTGDDGDVADDGEDHHLVAAE